MRTHHDPSTRLVEALSAADASVRLRAALESGTAADPGMVTALVDRCAVEPDFFVRDMLTWALCRLPAETTVPHLLAELDSDVAQARSQALHTLSKIGDPVAWPKVAATLHDKHDEVARSAWRAAIALVPPGSESGLAAALGAELGRGDHDLQLSLGRALAALDEAAVPVLRAATSSPDPRVRAHAEATERIRVDPDSAFVLSVESAKRVAALGADAVRE
ncbi:HEAT repeat domain-containing protein [Rhodococcus sp. AB351]|uniref:HEAT repeat domain-containing protein n=1 Tax=Rhodococcus sp. AB351 TaxID=3413280 RepID=UPI003C1ECD44